MDAVCDLGKKGERCIAVQQPRHLGTDRSTKVVVVRYGGDTAAIREDINTMSARSGESAALATSPVNEVTTKVEEEDIQTINTL